MSCSSACSPAPQGTGLMFYRNVQAAGVCCAGRNAREAAQGVGALSERLQQEQRAQGEALMSNLRQELRRAAAAASADETAALSRLDTRLAVST